MSDRLSRRDFLKLTGLALGTTAIPQGLWKLETEAKEANWGNPVGIKDPISGLALPGPLNDYVADYTASRALDARLESWNGEKDARYLVDKIKETGVNWLQMSVFDPLGRVVGERKSTEENQDLLVKVCTEKELPFIPLLEISWDSNGKYDETPFPAHFNLDHDLILHPENMGERISYMLTKWKNKNWLKFQDKEGNNVYGISLIGLAEVGSSNWNLVSKNLDWVASYVEVKTGSKIGYLIDNTRLPLFVDLAKGESSDIDPSRLISEVPFGLYELPVDYPVEGHLDKDRVFDAETQNLLQDSADKRMEAIVESGKPFNLAVNDGLDHRVLGWNRKVMFGFNDSWNERELKRVRKYANHPMCRGINFGIMMSPTERYGIFPTQEDGNLPATLAAEAIKIFKQERSFLARLR